MSLLSFFRKRGARTAAQSSTTSRKPRGKIAAATLAPSICSEPKSIADLAERMDADYQVQLARRVLAANIQSARVSISAPEGDERAAALCENLKRLWDQTLPSMLPAIAYGRVAFEKVFRYDAAHNLLLIKSLDALPFRETQLVLDDEGRYDGIDLTLTSAKIDLPAQKSWWLALDDLNRTILCSTSLVLNITIQQDCEGISLCSS